MERREPVRTARSLPEERLPARAHDSERCVFPADVQGQVRLEPSKRGLQQLCDGVAPRERTFAGAANHAEPRGRTRGEKRIHEITPSPSPWAPPQSAGCPARSRTRDELPGRPLPLRRPAESGARSGARTGTRCAPGPPATPARRQSPRHQQQCVGIHGPGPASVRGQQRTARRSAAAASPPERRTERRTPER
jgi:hypothetical protein